MKTKEISPWAQKIPKGMVFQNGCLSHVKEVLKMQIRLECLHAEERGVIIVDCPICG